MAGVVNINTQDLDGDELVQETAPVNDGYAGINDPDDLPPPCSLAEMKARISERCHIALGDDDPLVAVHTMHELFIEDLQRSLTAFMEVMSHRMGDVGTTCAKAVGECLDVLKNETLDSSLKNTLVQVGEHARTVGGLEQTIRNFKKLLWAAIAVISIGLGSVALLLVMVLLQLGRGQ